MIANWRIKKFHVTSKLPVHQKMCMGMPLGSTCPIKGNRCALHPQLLMQRRITWVKPFSNLHHGSHIGCGDGDGTYRSGWEKEGVRKSAPVDLSRIHACTNGAANGGNLTIGCSRPGWIQDGFDRCCSSFYLSLLQFHWTLCNRIMGVDGKNCTEWNWTKLPLLGSHWGEEVHVLWAFLSNWIVSYSIKLDQLDGFYGAHLSIALSPLPLWRDCWCHCQSLLS